MESNKKLQSLIIGATGAVGRELVDELMIQPNYSKITVVARRKIDRWEKFTEEQLKKFNFIYVDSLDFLGGTKEEIEKVLNCKDSPFDTCFCCLGSRTGRGKEEFYKVDFTYVVQSTELCEKLNIKHFSLVSTVSANKNSWFYYFQVKGQAEDEVLKKKVKNISINRPGIILDRDNDSRLGESVVGFIPFMSKITAKNIAKAMRIEDVRIISEFKEDNHQKNLIWENDDLERIVKSES